MSDSKRTKIEDLPKPVKELTEDEEKGVRGGVGVPFGEQGSSQTGATRASIVTTYNHEGGHTAEDRGFDADQNE